MAKIGQRPVLDYCYGEVGFILSRWTGQGELIRPPDLRGRIITDLTLDTLRKVSGKIPHKRGIECEQSTLRRRARAATPSAAFAVGRIKEAPCRAPPGHAAGGCGSCPRSPSDRWQRHSPLLSRYSVNASGQQITPHQPSVHGSPRVQPPSVQSGVGSDTIRGNSRAGAALWEIVQLASVLHR